MSGHARNLPADLDSALVNSAQGAHDGVVAYLRGVSLYCEVGVIVLMVAHPPAHCACLLVLEV